MKKTILTICCFFLFLNASQGLVQAFASEKNIPRAQVSDVSQGDGSDTGAEVREKPPKSLGERMVDFIRQLLGDEQKPVNEELVRDEQ